MTERLYLQDSHLTRCEAIVLSCAPAGDGFDAVLDRTVFFPNAGGQPSDTGMVGGVRCTRCEEADGVLLHHVEAALPVGETVQLEIDFERRFDHMQQHTGEHLLSYAFFRLFSSANVGFHMAEDYTTVDLDAPMTQEQMQAAAQLANRFVTQDLPVESMEFESEEALLAAGLPLRKQAEGLHAPIRIVQIQDADCCTCCAPHCKRTGEVGAILITDAVSYKGGTRLSILCGQRALRYAGRVHADMNQMARRFSTGRDTVALTVAKLQDEHTRLKRRERELQSTLFGYIARDLCEASHPVGSAKLIVGEEKALAPEALRQLAQRTLSGRQTLTLLYSEFEGRLCYVLCCTEDLHLDMGELCTAVNAAFSGKGGGRGTLAQGTAQAGRGTPETAEQLRHYFEKRLQNR